MAASRANSALDRDLSSRQHKANSANQHNDLEINGSDRVLGLDGTADGYGSLTRPDCRWHQSLTDLDHRYRPRSRSPSPYRRRVSRSPSPYRNRRAIDRSPSPFRHGGRNRGPERSYPKRKGSPPRGGRPEKRHHTDRGRSDRGSSFHAAEGRGVPTHSNEDRPHKDMLERSFVKPISYAELEKANAVPNFQDAVPTEKRPQNSTNTDSQKRAAKADNPRGPTARAGVQQDVEMTSDPAETDYTIVPVEEKVPTEESREEKRRRWAAKRAAAEQKNQNLLQQAVLTNASEANTPNSASPAQYAESPMSPFASPRNTDVDSVPGSPDVMVIDKPEATSEVNSPAAASPSAADYDPMQDMLDDRDRAAKKNSSKELSSNAYEETDPKVLSTLPAEKIVPIKKQKKELDMFASDDEDEDEDEVVEEGAGAKGTVLDEKMLDNWDDPEGYYKIISNELINGGRYRVIRTLGRGVFANVAQAEDQSANIQDPTHKLVAIKMIRRNDMMRKASQKEMDFLRRVNEADEHDKRHIIRLFDSFDHKGHLCIVFEHMSKNLRDLLKEETNGRGLALPAVRVYAKQMFYGLQHLQNCKVIHLDLKPDNVLVSADKKTIKLADFGTAVDKQDTIERTEYLVSRFYRAPEIILGWDISFPADMWAVGCTIYELWTGKILFTGRSNNQMVKAFMDCLGWPSEKLLKKGLANYVLAHFEIGSSLKFISREVDQQNQITVRKIEQQRKINRDMKIRVHDAARGMAADTPTVADLNDLSDLLTACLHMNVEKRLSPKEAINHKFFGAKPLAAKSAVVKPPMMKRAMPGIRR
ncbi:kinase-like domain-containing protein [Phaeosphaeria sp. MPI-PUGE-AT-0046c]|nr:kinase-like domain-containing protein [Phaeosphaeria sp. MPI-PUGE-AT-0046c]